MRISSLLCQILVTSLFKILQEKQETAYNFLLLFFWSPFKESCQNSCWWIVIVGNFWGQLSDSCQIETLPKCMYEVLSHVLKQLIKMLLLCNCFQSWWAGKKIFLDVQNHSHIFWINCHWYLNFLNFLSLKILYIGGKWVFEPLFKPVLIGSVVRYFDTIRTTVNCFKCNQEVIFGKYWGFDKTATIWLIDCNLSFHTDTFML